jgi:hypothetical protein
MAYSAVAAIINLRIVASADLSSDLVGSTVTNVAVASAVVVLVVKLATYLLSLELSTAERKSLLHRFHWER